MAEDTKPVRKEIRGRSPHHRVVYANQISCTGTGMDLRLRFGIVEFGSTAETRIEDQVDVMINPVVAHQLQSLLSRQLKRFDIQEMKADDETTDVDGKAKTK